MRKTTVFLILSICLFSRILLAKNIRQMNASLTSLEIIREEIRQRALPILVMFKQLENTEVQTAPQRAKIIKSAAEVHENDLSASPVILNVQLNDEFPVLEKRDEWYRVRLSDGREGWLHENDLQTISTRDSREMTTGGYSQEALAEAIELSNLWLVEINAQRDSAAQVYHRAMQNFQSLSESEKQPLQTTVTKLKKAFDQIPTNEYHKFVLFFREAPVQ